MARVPARLRLRRVVAIVTLAVVLALPAAALAHPGHPNAPPPPVESTDSGGGGTSPVLIAGIVVGVIATAGALYAIKELQHRPSAPKAKAAAGPAPDPKQSKPALPDGSGAAPEPGA